MSTLNPKSPSDESADAINRQVAAWIERRDFGDWSDEDRADFDAWLSKSSARRVAFLRANFRWSRTEMLGALRSFRSDDAHTSIPHSSRLFFAKITAVMAVLMTLGAAAIFHFAKPHETIYATPVGGHRTVILADGSRVELNTSTILRVGVSTDRKVVSLVTGEAYFQIKHDSQHPFVVIAGAHKVTDLGTKFLVRNDTDRLTVALVEGRASIQSNDASILSHSTVLTPGDVVVATANTMSVTRKPVSELAHKLGWRHGVLVFDNTTLADAAMELNRYNRRKIVVADPSVARLTIVGTFPENDVEAVADAAKEVFGLQVQNRGDEIVISR